VEHILEDAKTKVAELINGGNEKTIIFTASATEANNLAIRRTALRNISKGQSIQRA